MEGDGNTAIGYHSGSPGDVYNLNGSQNTFLGAYSGPYRDGLTNATAIGYGAFVWHSNEVRIGNPDFTEIHGSVGFNELSNVRVKR